MTSTEINTQLKSLIRPYVRPGPKFRKSLTRDEVQDLLENIYHIIKELECEQQKRAS